MRAAFFDKPYSIKFIDAIEPNISADDDVKIHIAYTGICGSEIHAFCGTHPTRVPPVISGHEAAGVVTDVGKNVVSVKVGDRVAIEPQYSCGICPDCLQGSYNICHKKIVLGTIHWSGSFGEYIIAPERAVLKLPDTVSFEQGALLEPLAVGIHAVRLSDVKMGKTVVILGCGPIGISLLIGCKLSGAQTVIMTDVVEYNLDIAKKMGADFIINSKQEDPVARVLGLTGGLGADVVFLAVGENSIMNQGVECVKRKGQIMEIAHFGTEPTMDVRKFRWKEARMMGSYMYVREDFEIVMNAIASDKIDVDPMISKIMPVEDCVNAIDLVYHRKENFIKVMLKF